jgi:hypothetical protein
MSLREATGYLVQLRDLYRARSSRSVKEYRQLSADEVRAIVQAAR